MKYFGYPRTFYVAVDFLIIGPILYLNLAPKNCIQILKSLNKNYYIT